MAIILKDFIFLSHVAFISQGAFLNPKERLLLLKTNEAPKNSAALSRAAKRRLELEEKEVDRAGDNTNIRRFNTDQRISIESLVLKKTSKTSGKRIVHDYSYSSRKSSGTINRFSIKAHCGSL